MTERLGEMQRMVSDSRARLGALAERLSAARRRLEVLSGPPQAAIASDEEDVPLLFEEDESSGSGAIEESELNFKALDYEDPEREGR